MSEKTKQIKALRELTNVSMSVCKDALEKTDYDQIKALSFLKELGVLDANRRRERKVAEGRVISYIHGPGRIGVLLQVDCESDFVAKCSDFEVFMHEVCLQIAAANPAYIDVSDVENDRIEAEKAAFMQAANVGKPKPPAILEKIVAGKIDKWFAQVVLLEQPWVKDQTKKIRDLLNELIQKTGENIKISRFARFEAGALAETKE